MTDPEHDANVETQVLRLDPDRATWRKLDDELIVLDLQNSNYVSINPTGVELWPMLERGSTRDQLTQALMAAFDVDEATARADIDTFITDIDARGLFAD